MKLLLYILSVVVVLRGYEIKGCLQNERAGLIQIKSYFSSINQDKTGIYDFPAWHVADNKSDCCHWEGVECNPYTGRVVQLFLSRKVFTYEPWHLNMTFFGRFEELNTLVLSWNHIGSLVGSEGLCRFKDLEELDFRGNYLSGNLPHCLWNLTSLRSLDISENQFIGNLPPYINIPSIEWLFVNHNHFQGKFFFSSLSNHSRLQGLILSDNALQVEIEESPPCPSNFKPQALGLGNCILNTRAKTVWKFLSYQSNLQHIDLSDNALIGSFPTWLLHNNSNLKHLTLLNNLLTGSLQLTEHSNLSLVFLDISQNRFSGKIPRHIGMTLSKLKVLDFSNNSFQGHIPSSVGNMTHLVALELSGNKLSGELPWEMFFYCTNLKFLDLSFNNLQGEIIPKYMNLPWLNFLYLKNNHFVGTMKESLTNATSLQNLDISVNMVTGELPSCIGSLEKLHVLSLANNQFKGKIPIQICQLGSLGYMDLSSNRFVGEIPPCDINVISLKHLFMRGNNLTGAIPVGFASIAQLVTLDLANNHITGGISPWIGRLSNLGTLILRGNQLQGELPNELCLLQHLNILDLSNNNFSGVIPSCLSGLSFGDTKLGDIYSYFEDVFEEGENLFDAPFDFPIYVYVMTSDEADFIVKSRYASYRDNILSIMSALDLSCNQLVGDIPLELGDLTMINALNFSHNCLNGSIPESFSKLKSIESLDLSSNKLSGKVPWQLVDLNFLEIFNVSYNNLSGEVPETGQFGAFDENNYRGNHDLCGSRLPKKCAVMEPPSSPLIEEGGEGETRFDMEVFLWSFAVSFITMLLATFLVLYINAGWRRAWFTFVDLHLLWWIYQ